MADRLPLFPKMVQGRHAEKIHDFLRGMFRKGAGREESPFVACMESQRVKGTCRGLVRRGDRGKLVKGRKRHIVTATRGLSLAVMVHPANRHDSKAERDVLRMLKPEFKRLKRIYAEGGGDCADG